VVRGVCLAVTSPAGRARSATPDVSAPAARRRRVSAANVAGLGACWRAPAARQAGVTCLAGSRERAFRRLLWLRLLRRAAICDDARVAWRVVRARLSTARKPRTALSLSRSRRKGLRTCPDVRASATAGSALMLRLCRTRSSGHLHRAGRSGHAYVAALELGAPLRVHSRANVNSGGRPACARQAA
jgi:hypothetical protein